MKRLFFFLSFFFTSFLIHAQEAEEAVESDAGWSNETKMSMLAVWGLIVLILTVRTFRNKADM